MPARGGPVAPFMAGSGLLPGTNGIKACGGSKMPYVSGAPKPFAPSLP